MSKQESFKKGMDNARNASFYGAAEKMKAVDLMGNLLKSGLRLQDISDPNADSIR